jgi:hypothetical protein
MASRAFIMLKFLEAERVMNKKLNEYVKSYRCLAHREK